jgi:hypothetical protein
MLNEKRNLHTCQITLRARTLFQYLLQLGLKQVSCPKIFDVAPIGNRPYRRLLTGELSPALMRSDISHPPFINAIVLAAHARRFILKG